MRVAEQGSHKGRAMAPEQWIPGLRRLATKVHYGLDKSLGQEGICLGQLFPDTFSVFPVPEPEKKAPELTPEPVQQFPRPRGRVCSENGFQMQKPMD